MRKVASWTLSIAGCVYPILLAVQGIVWLIDRQSVRVHVPMLVGSIAIAAIGVWLRERGHKEAHQNEEFV